MAVTMTANVKLVSVVVVHISCLRCSTELALCQGNIVPGYKWGTGFPFD